MGVRQRLPEVSGLTGDKDAITPRPEWSKDSFGQMVASGRVQSSNARTAGSQPHAVDVVDQ